MVYKHAISTVVPSRVVRMPLQNPAEDEADGGDS
jgi:host factor-I protein